MKHGLLIKEVHSGGLGQEMELEPGDRLVAINGHPLRDLIDYEFHISDDPLLLEVERQEMAEPKKK